MLDPDRFILARTLAANDCCYYGVVRGLNNTDKRRVNLVDNISVANGNPSSVPRIRYRLKPYSHQILK